MYMINTITHVLAILNGCKRELMSHEVLKNNFECHTLVYQLNEVKPQKCL